MLTWLAVLLFAGINVNTATATELEALPGIGPSKATAIVEYREANGPYSSLGELDAVPGIGPATLENMKSEVEFGEGGAAPVAVETTPDAAPSPAMELAAPPPTGKSGGGVNVNTASSSQLESLPGIGPAKARAIVEDREAKGPFASCSDLTRVNGIGDATVKTIGDDCAVN